MPRAQANPELPLIAASKEDDAPIFLAKVLLKFQARNTPQQRGEPLGTAHSQNAAAVLLVTDKRGRMTECDVGAHLLRANVRPISGRHGGRTRSILLRRFPPWRSAALA